MNKRTSEQVNKQTNEQTNKQKNIAHTQIQSQDQMQALQQVVICAITMIFAILTKVSAKLTHIPSCICDANGVKHNGVFSFALIFLKNRNNIFVDSLAGGGPFKDFEV